jgi:hypothetical protein
VKCPDLLGDAGRLVDGGPEPAPNDLAGLGRRAGTETIDPLVVTDLLADQAGKVEDEPVGAAVERQRQRLGGTAVGGRELLGEAGEIAARRTPPLVNRLVGVADGGHGEAVPEDAAQQLALGRIGVLVLVQQRDPVPGAHQICHLGPAVEQVECQADEIGEVDGAPAAQRVAQELAGVAGGDDNGITFDPDCGAELAQQVVGEAVVGGHLDAPPFGGVAGQQRGDTRRQLGGGLVGEGDAERLFGRQLAARHE